MIQLKQVSKFYYSKGMISTGFTKVNLELHVGEFVVITGASGSGKSTLLNVISGLDTYDEGEMRIDGQETSHFSDADMEEYRKKYIGNIFQDFNLIASYTVYQNVELILILNGYSKKRIASIVPEILAQVGLSEYARTKVSKLSGGQKQRVSIARALAKDTAVIVADEPTGNLDSRAAEGIARLLGEIAADKLVIVVIHNEEQFAPYATRVVRMNDGRIIEDQCLRRTVPRPLKESRDGTITGTQLVQLGMRNAFNLLSKFLLLFLVFLFLCFSISSLYTGFKETRAEGDLLGTNQFFTDTSSERIVVKKKNGSPFRQTDYRKIRHLPGTDYVEKNDILLDTNVYIEQGDLSLYGIPGSLDTMKGTPEVGRMPEKGNEAVLRISRDDISDEAGSMLNQTYRLQTDDGFHTRITVVGIQYRSEEELPSENRFYLRKTTMTALRDAGYLEHSTVETWLNGQIHRYESGEPAFRIVANRRVDKGTALVPESWNVYYEDETIRGKQIRIQVSNMYWTASVSLRTAAVYREKNFRRLTGRTSYHSHAGEIYVNPEDADRLFHHGTYQISVFAGTDRQVDRLAEQLRTKGFTALPIKDTLSRNQEGTTILNIIQIPFYILIAVAVFFISYFVIRLILKSRSSYFSVLRMLGMSRKNTRRILDVELLTDLTLAYLVFFATILLARAQIISSERMQNMASWLNAGDDVILYIMMLLIAFLLSGRFARTLFRSSAMDARRKEA